MIHLIASGHAPYPDFSPDTAKRVRPRVASLVRLARLRFLAPDIVAAIVNGRQPVDLTSRSLLRIAELPLAWAEQQTMLGFG